MPDEKKSAGLKRGNDSTGQHLAKANNLLAELEEEDKQGYNLRDSHDDDFDMGLDDNSKKNKGGFNDLKGGISKEEPSNDIGDNYDDDFDDEIEEDLPEQNDVVDDTDLNARSANNVAGSGQGITVSQSLGVDPSVDSLALEDYDHVEPVERIA